MSELRKRPFPIVHQVRHPLRTIASATVIGSKSRAFLKNESSLYKTPDNLLFAMRYWYWWKLQSQKKAVLTFKVEDVETEMPRLLRLADMQNKNRVALALSRSVNARVHPNISWNDCKNKDPVLTERIKELAFAYGYRDI